MTPAANRRRPLEPPPRPDAPRDDSRVAVVSRLTMRHGTDPGAAYLNAVGTATPEHEVHAEYLAFARRALGDTRDRSIFDRLVARSQIERRFGVVSFAMYDGAQPDTAARMRAYERHALTLAERAVESLGIDRARAATHLILTTCTGFYAPGIDIELIARVGLSPGIERTVVGFMGCYAAVTALKLARHIVRSDAGAIVLVVNLELSSLHLQRPANVEQAMGFSIFGDGCAASIVSGDAAGISLDGFTTTLIPETAGEITWGIGNLGFDMRLSMDVPRLISRALAQGADRVLGGIAPGDVDLWAVHPGGRAVLDAVSEALGLVSNALDTSREVLRRFGNMSSATMSFVLERVLDDVRAGGRGAGCALAFGPGMVCEAMRFTAAS